MKRLLIAGGKFADIPTIKSAQMLGYYVITSGNNPNDLGHSFANEVALCDYSDMEGMLKLAKDLHIDALISACDDVSALTCSFVSHHLGIGNFDNIEVSKIIHNKDLWRNFLQENNLNSPKAMGFSDINEAINTIPILFKDSKIIIKPVDFATGKGVNTAMAQENLYQKLEIAKQHSKSGRIVVEEFLNGSNHGFSTILHNQKVIFYFYDDEQHDFNPFSVSGTTTSQSFNKEIIQNIIDQIETIARILHLKDGIFHTQIILHTTKTGKITPYIIEACRRMGGDLYPEFVSQACNIDYPSLCIQAHNQATITHIFAARHDKVLDKTIKATTSTSYQGGLIKPTHKKYFARQCIMSKYTGTIKHIDLSVLLCDDIIKQESSRDSNNLSYHNKNISNYSNNQNNANLDNIRESIRITDSLIWAKNGDIISDTTKYKAGIVFLQSSTKEQLDTIIVKLYQCLQLTKV